MVHPKTDGSHAYHLDLKIPDSLASFTYTADAIRRHGAIPSLELSHSGQYAGTYMTDKDKKQSLHQHGVSPSVRADGLEIKELSKEMIKEIIAAYGEAAKNAKRAGFEMLMVHCGHGCNVYLAAEIKKHVSKPVATLGGLNDPAQMEEIIASGKADVVEMARALLADHELPRKVMSNRDEDIIKCLRCFTCMVERAATSTRRCTVNPLIGRQRCYCK